MRYFEPWINFTIYDYPLNFDGTVNSIVGVKVVKLVITMICLIVQ